ncbi:MAG: hypothetical protein ACD_82C00104G0002 [uncultured bacterium]|jgi:hypothetical protein|nr:MAG: hypothetical protein ACD_82C00104G0002 [uncultured bacterium]KKP29890.1 MAG: hypothetical protein UR12_C0001G0025 [candidate division TM6 bacterium GW2011_GWF2_30_66]
MNVLTILSSRTKNNNLHIKIISAILGYAFWYAISQSHAAKIWLEAPICFYNIQKDTKISCKEKIYVQLFAKHADLYTIDKETLAFHVDAANLQDKNTIIKLEPEQLLLPESIKMVRCNPAIIAVSVEKEKPVTI